MDGGNNCNRGDRNAVLGQLTLGTELLVVIRIAIEVTAMLSRDNSVMMKNC